MLWNVRVSPIEFSKPPIVTVLNAIKAVVNGMCYPRQRVKLLGDVEAVHLLKWIEYKACENIESIHIDTHSDLAIIDPGVGS